MFDLIVSKISSEGGDFPRITDRLVCNRSYEYLLFVCCKLRAQFCFVFCFVFVFYYL